MGFFSDLKEDLNQAVNELLPGSEADDEPVTEKAATTQADGQPDEVNDTLREIEELEATLRDMDEMQQAQFAKETKEQEAQAAKALQEWEEQAAKAVREREAQKKEAQAARASLTREAQAILREKELQAEATQAERAAEKPGEPIMPAETVGTMEEPKVQAVKKEETPAVHDNAGKYVQETFAEVGGQLKISLAEPEVKPQKPQIPVISPAVVEKKVEKRIPEGEKKVDAYASNDAIRTGEDVIDKSWVLDLRSMEQMEETAVITAGMRVKGDILSNGSADIFGEVYGNVQVKGKLNVTGKIVGNSKGEEIMADAARINGDVISDGAVRIGVGSVVVGNVEATDAIIAGAVKGTIDVRGPVVIDAAAVVLGNIRAKSIQINNGARIEGMCVLCYAEQSAARFFEEQEQ